MEECLQAPDPAAEESSDDSTEDLTEELVELLAEKLNERSTLEVRRNQVEETLDADIQPWLQPLPPSHSPMHSRQPTPAERAIINARVVAAGISEDLKGRTTRPPSTSVASNAAGLKKLSGTDLARKGAADLKKSDEQERLNIVEAGKKMSLARWQAGEGRLGSISNPKPPAVVVPITEEQRLRRQFATAAARIESRVILPQQLTTEDADSTETGAEVHQAVTKDPKEEEAEKREQLLREGRQERKKRRLEEKEALEMKDPKEEEAEKREQLLREGRQDREKRRLEEKEALEAKEARMVERRKLRQEQKEALEALQAKEDERVERRKRKQAKAEAAIEATKGNSLTGEPTGEGSPQ